MGQRLKGGEVIELVSDLGGGKTTFVRGLVEGAGSGDHVSSPTFTISNIYKTKKFDIHHFDFYRLDDAGIMEHELHDALEPTNVVIVEWSDVAKHVLPDKRITVSIKSLGDDERKLEIKYSKSYEYVVKGL